MHFMKIDTIRETYGIWISIVVAGGGAIGAMRSQLTPMFLSNKQHCVQFRYTFYDILHMSYDSIEVIAASHTRYSNDELKNPSNVSFTMAHKRQYDTRSINFGQNTTVGDNCELNWTEHRSNCYVYFAQHKRTNVFVCGSLSISHYSFWIKI